jgi:ribosomal RNA methyltransferase Nop2
VPKEFITRWEEFYGKKKAEEIERKLHYQDPRIITPNSLQTDTNTLKHNLEKKRFRFVVLGEFNSLKLDYEPYNIVSTPEYLSGMFSIQALTSLIPPFSLNPPQGSLVADLATSPGIKTCFLGQIMENTGTILGFEKSKQRISALKSNIARMGIRNSIILNCDSKSLPKFGLKFDHILLDAPCSGTGLKMTKNKRISKRTFSDIGKHAKLQENLMEIAWNHLKVGGSLAYSTCSLEPEEGETQIKKFLEKHGEQSELLPVHSNLGRSGQETIFNSEYSQETPNTVKKFMIQGGFFQKSELMVSLLH